eukprot:167689-Prymnesium_polylepis.1
MDGRGDHLTQPAARTHATGTPFLRDARRVHSPERAERCATGAARPQDWVALGPRHGGDASASRGAAQSRAATVGGAAQIAGHGHVIVRSPDSRFRRHTGTIDRSQCELRGDAMAEPEGCRLISRSSDRQDDVMIVLLLE